MSPRSFHLGNWMEAPHNRAAFQRTREIVPTALITRNGGDVFELSRQPVALEHVAFAPNGTGSTPITWGDHLDRSFADGVCVVHHGQVVFERYFNGMTDRTPHLLMSVSKSFCGAALGIAIGRELLGADDLVTEIAPELAGTSLDGATVGHVIDMTAGTGFVEDYDDYSDPSGDVPLIEYERHAGYRPLGNRVPTGVLGHFRTYPLERPHGEWFSYRSPLTNIAARVLEVVHGLPYPDIVSRDLWTPLGMEHDADIMLDPLGQAVVEGGMSCTLRDLARFGLAYLGHGSVGGRNVLPTAWIDDTRWADDENRRAFSAGPEASDPGPWTSYRNAWWIERPGEVMSGLGIFGQYCWVDRAADVVIARCSTYPTALPTHLGLETLHGFRAIADHLAALG